MKTKQIMDISVIGREVEFKSNELFAIYNLIHRLDNLKYAGLSSLDQDIIIKTINLLSNIIDKNAMDNLLYSPCSDIFEFTKINQENPATVLDKSIHSHE